MKRIKFLSFCFIAVCLLTACGNKITVKGEDGTVYESYQECCAVQDFQAAHQFLAKMQNSDSEEQQMQWNEAKEFVFKQEALYLMSIGDEAAKKRLIYLLKEEGGNDNHANMLIELAIDNDDEEFVKTLTKHYKSTISTNILRKIVEYLYLQKGDGNLDFVQTLLNRYNQNGLLLDAAVEKGNEELVISLAQQDKGSLSFQSFKNVMNFLSSRNSSQYIAIRNLLVNKVTGCKELFLYAVDNKIPSVVNSLFSKYVNVRDLGILSTLAAKKDQTVSNAIVNLISRIKIEGTRIPKGMYEYTTFRNNYSSYRPDYLDYMKSINDYNKICNQILEIAISKGNDYLAKNILLMYKEDVYKLKGSDEEVVKAPDGKRVNNYNYYYVYYTNDSKNNAQKRYREAKMNGAFK